ncbi:unnamed protein product [Ixodes pacificus]
MTLRTHKKKYSQCSLAVAFSHQFYIASLCNRINTNGLRENSIAPNTTTIQRAMSGWSRNARSLKLPWLPRKGVEDARQWQVWMKVEFYQEKKNLGGFLPIIFASSLLPRFGLVYERARLVRDGLNAQL